MGNVLQPFTPDEARKGNNTQNHLTDSQMAVSEYGKGNIITFKKKKDSSLISFMDKFQYLTNEELDEAIMIAKQGNSEKNIKVKKILWRELIVLVECAYWREKEGFV